MTENDALTFESPKLAKYSVLFTRSAVAAVLPSRQCGRLYVTGEREPSG